MTFKKNLAKLTIITLPFLNLFSLGIFSNFTFLFAVMYLFIKVLIDRKIKIKTTNYYIFLLILFILFSVYMSSLKSPVHNFYKIIIMYLSLFIYSLSIYNILYEYKIHIFSKWLYFGLIITFIYGLSDFVLSNLFKIHLDNYLYRFTIKNNPGTVGNLFRIRSTLDEPGNLAYYINSLFPISLIYALENKKFFYIILGLANFILTFSATGLFACVISFVLIYMYNNLSLKKIYILITVLIVLILLNYIFKDNIYYQITVGKLLLDPNNSSASSRVENLKYGISMLKRMIDSKLLFLGFGSAYFEDNGLLSIFNYHFTLLLENGLIGFGAWIIFLIVQMKKSFRINGNYGYLIRYSLLTSIIHLTFIGSIYFYFIWYVFIVIDYFDAESKDEYYEKRYIS